MSLQMFTDDEECVIAESVDDAKAILDEMAKPFTYDHDPDVEWTPLPMDQSFAFDHQDARGVETKTVAEWIASEGRGYFAGPI